MFMSEKIHLNYSVLNAKTLNVAYISVSDFSKAVKLTQPILQFRRIACADSDIYKPLNAISRVSNAAEIPSMVKLFGHVIVNTTVEKC